MAKLKIIQDEKLITPWNSTGFAIHVVSKDGKEEIVEDVLNARLGINYSGRTELELTVLNPIGYRAPEHDR